MRLKHLSATQRLRLTYYKGQRNYIFSHCSSSKLAKPPFERSSLSFPFLQRKREPQQHIYTHSQHFVF